MINRELTEREREIFGMIRPTTFQDIVDVVRRDVEQSKYDAKRELRNLRNDVPNKVTSDVVASRVIGTNGRNRINNVCGGDICEVLI